MASADVVTAVAAYLAANWTATPVRYPNERDSQPPIDGSAFLEVQFPVATNRHVGLGPVGSRTFREEGVIRLVLAAPTGDGQDVSLALCQQLSTLFLAKQFGGVTTRTPNSPTTDNSNDAGNYWITSIAVPYFYDYLG